jgi:hypothetical protein
MHQAMHDGVDHRRVFGSIASQQHEQKRILQQRFVVFDSMRLRQATLAVQRSECVVHARVLRFKPTYNQCLASLRTRSTCFEYVSCTKQPRRCVDVANCIEDRCQRLWLYCCGCLASNVCTECNQQLMYHQIRAVTKRLDSSAKHTKALRQHCERQVGGTVRCARLLTCEASTTPHSEAHKTVDDRSNRWRRVDGGSKQRRRVAVVDVRRINTTRITYWMCKQA